MTQLKAAPVSTAADELTKDVGFPCATRPHNCHDADRPSDGLDNLKCLVIDDETAACRIFDLLAPVRAAIPLAVIWVAQWNSPPASRVEPTFLCRKDRVREIHPC